jgi:raffinose/stachyose/melibiose transport system permease protein
MWLWNDFNISIILLQKDVVRTLTVKQYYFFGQYSSAYGMAFAAAILSMVPVVVCFLLLQKYIISGISAGAVKS